MADLTSYKDKRVLVTGANGLVGAHLIEELIRYQAKVYAMILDVDLNSYYVQTQISKSVREYFVDLNDGLALQRVVSQIQPDYVFHLAAETQVKSAFLNPFLTYHTNFLGTLNLIECLRTTVKGLRRVVMASTDKVYGESNKLPYTEEHRLKAHGPYDTSKACMDLLSQSYALTFKMPISIIRAGNIFGPGDMNWERIIPGVSRWLIKGETPILRGKSSMIRDYVFVKDVAKAYLLSGLEDVNSLEIYNVSSNQPMSLDTLYSTICNHIIGEYVPPILELTDVPEIHEQYLDNSRIKGRLTWQPEFSFDSSLSLTIDWYREIVSA